MSNTHNTPATYTAYIMGAEDLEAVDLRTLTDEKLADLIIEAGANGDSDLIDTIAHVLSDRALNG